MKPSRAASRRAPGAGLVRFVGAALCLCLSAPAVLARAAAPRESTRLTAACKVYVINGLGTRGPLPKELEHLRKELTAQPFRVFLSFQFLKLLPMTAVEGQSVAKVLDENYQIELLLKEQLLTSRNQRRLRFVLTLNRTSTRERAAKQILRSTLLLDRGSTLFLAGPPHQQGKLVIGLTCE
jgi:hypothetical protein